MHRAGCKFRFNGIASHAAAVPERGRSALDAVEIHDVAVNFLREHVPQETRMHYAITDGGGQPNKGSASTDGGDISWVVPASSLSTATCVSGTAPHSWQAASEWHEHRREGRWSRRRLWL